MTDRLDPPALQKLREYKDAEGISVSELARRLGPVLNEKGERSQINPSTVHRWFNSGSIPDSAQQVLCERLVPGITREDWLTQEDRARILIDEKTAPEPDASAGLQLSEASSDEESVSSIEGPNLVNPVNAPSSVPPASDSTPKVSIPKHDKPIPTPDPDGAI